MQVSEQSDEQRVCEWLLTSAVILVIVCGWHRTANGAHWDILKNLVANTRLQQSTPAQVPAFPGWHPGGGSCPAEMKTSARSMGQCVEG